MCPKKNGAHVKEPNIKYSTYLKNSTFNFLKIKNYNHNKNKNNTNQNKN